LNETYLALSDALEENGELHLAEYIRGLARGTITEATRKRVNGFLRVSSKSLRAKARFKPVIFLEDVPAEYRSRQQIVLSDGQCRAACRHPVYGYSDCLGAQYKDQLCGTHRNILREAGQCTWEEELRDRKPTRIYYEPPVMSRQEVDDRIALIMNPPWPRPGRT
jgi:hypothetical protein